MGASTSNIEHLVGLIYDAASDSRKWPDALECMRQCLEASAVGFSEYDFLRESGNIVHYVGFDPAFVRRYEHAMSHHNVWMVDGPWYSEGTISRGGEIISPEGLVASKFYKQWMQPQGLFHRLCGVIRRDGERVIIIEVMRSRTQGEFDESQSALFASLLPHLLTATQRSTHLWRLVVSLDIINSLPFAVLAVDNGGRVLFSNRLADETLNENRGLILRDGEIGASASRTASQLKEMIASAAGASAGRNPDPGSALLIPRGRGMQPLWVVVAPMNRRLRRIVGQELEVALVFASAPEHVGKMQETTLRRYFGLTAAEQRLALLILKGYRLDEAAIELKISHNTVRSHMKRIYVKTKTERQTDLVRVLLSGPLGSASLQDVV